MAISKIHLLSAAVTWSLTALALAQPADIKSPLSPEESLKHFQLDPLLTIELVAAEPQVVDPVAIRFDEDGRLWVAEMRDYPLGPIKKTDGKRTEKDAEPLSQIKILEDKNGDGRFETATVFADKLLFVTGLQPWKGGVIVTLSGKVAYMKDTDGDGKADVNETWFTGFSESNSQLRANHPTFALDNHIYVANGLRGGMVVNHLKKMRGERGEGRGQKSGVGFQPAQKESDQKDDAPINISGMDFRFDPLTGEAEAVSGNGQFGLCFDDWGNRFVCSNRNPCQHVVIENRYLKKAPTVAIPSVVQDVAAFAENSRIYPISKFWTTSNLHEGQFTAACGVFIYRGDLLPREFRGNVFTCDPTGNLVHREIMEAKGASFTSKPAYEGKEFLASPDTWFRPVSMELGPDGALYVVDMYRAVIEHPEWVPDELKNRPDERLGDDRGRIYRIVPKERVERRNAVDRFSQAESKTLVKLLGNLNAWKREVAHRLLIGRQDKSASDELKQIVLKNSSEHMATHALWLLAGNGESILPAAAKSMNPRPSPNLVIQLLKHWEGRTKESIDVRTALPQAALDLQMNLSALFNSAENLEDSLKNSDLKDVWVQQSLRLRWGERQAALLSKLIWNAKVGAKGEVEKVEKEILSFEKSIALSVGQKATDTEALLQLDSLLMLWKNQIPVLSLDFLPELGKGLRRRGVSLDALVAKSDRSALKSSFAELKSLLVKQIESGEEIDSEAIELLACMEGTSELLTKLAFKGENLERRKNVLRELGFMPENSHWPEIIAAFPGQSPSVRATVLDGVFQRPERISLLLDSLESGSIKPTELDPVQTGWLLKHGDAKIRERAEKIFGSATPEDRKKALADYQSVLTLTGDAKRGQVSFAKNCATCHKIGETGVNVAPDISDSRTKTPAQILADIIQPNRAIDANYVGYNLLLTDGTTTSGILTSETSTSITLKAAGAKVITVARGEIEQLKSTGVSLMPDGLEKTIPPQEMADVIAFIKNWRYLDGRVPVK